MGRIVRPHGIRGDVIVHRFGEDPEILQPGARLRLGDAGPVLVVGASRPHQRQWIVTFAGVGDRSQAEKLAGFTLTVEAATLPALPEGEYYTFQILGLRVRTAEGALLGTIEEILETGAQDVYVVRGEGREVLLPALRDVVRKVDLEAGEMTVVPLPGLLDEDPGAGKPSGRGSGEG